MPDTLPEIRARFDEMTYDVDGRRWSRVAGDNLAEWGVDALAYIDALTAAVEGLPEVGASRTDGALVSRAAVLAILRGKK